MSTVASATPTKRYGASLRTRVAAILVLIGLAAIAAYAMFAGPTTVHLTTTPQAAPAQSAPQEPGEGGEGGGGD